MTNSHEVYSILSTRFALYTMMSRIFDHEPDEEILQLVGGDDFVSACSFLEHGSELAHKMSCLAHDVNALDTLSNEYTVLFIGPNKLPVPLWESVYVDKENLLFTQTTLSVRNEYRKAGYIPNGYPHVPDDFIATELSFLAAQSKAALDAFSMGDSEKMKAYLSVQKEFISLHIGRWIDVFAQRLASTDFYSDFYSSSANLCKELVLADCSYVLPLLVS